MRIERAKMSGKAKKELMSSAPWRVQEETGDEFADAKLKVTRQQAGADSTMHVPRKKTKQQRYDEDDSLTEIDPELRYSFHRNYQVTSFELLHTCLNIDSWLSSGFLSF